jgi:hypothetical protein
VSTPRKLNQNKHAVVKVSTPRKLNQNKHAVVTHAVEVMLVVLPSPRASSRSKASDLVAPTAAVTQQQQFIVSSVKMLIINYKRETADNKLRT